MLLLLNLQGSIYWGGGGGGGGGGEDSPPPPPPPKHSSFPPKIPVSKSSVRNCSMWLHLCALYRLMLHCIAFPYYDLKILRVPSEPLSEGSKCQNFLGGHAPRPPTNCIFVSCQRSARRKSSMTVTCIHTGHFHTMTSILYPSASEPL